MRLFIALETPEPLRREIAALADRLRHELPWARWVRAENLHLTLVFLGETAPDRLPSLAAHLAPAFGQHPPLRLRVRGAGTFPSGRAARVAWLGVAGGSELAALQAALAEAAAKAAGVELERRPFHAHLTLARPARPWPPRAVERFLASADRPRGEPFEVAQGVLLESQLGAGGARYRTVEAFPLAGRAPQ
ncbi:MAG: RNA 2',3'-cyclic phosphodiesterase [Thermoanaerobaculia bacterium]